MLLDPCMGVNFGILISCILRMVRGVGGLHMAPFFLSQKTLLERMGSGEWELQEGCLGVLVKETGYAFPTIPLCLLRSSCISQSSP